MDVAPKPTRITLQKGKGKQKQGFAPAVPAESLEQNKRVTMVRVNNNNIMCCGSRIPEGLSKV
ncbi:hypothetical protein DAPK24_008880 [Pichia kluyveri]|uniref:Uncharacterized protein n=1 Tax=Pichia kluyveri TaxID=36015 RepID=A0AAV5QYF8_PICKL|nr:hypothetical protein DAPK24_008880 [Pichia kluyveri]